MLVKNVCEKTLFGMIYDALNVAVRCPFCQKRKACLFLSEINVQERIFTAITMLTVVPNIFKSETKSVKCVIFRTMIK